MSVKKGKGLAISLPESYDLGYLPINQDSRIEFQVENRNDRPVSYLWKFTKFEVTPPNGVLLPLTRNKFEVVYRPTEANVVVATIVLECEGEQSRVFKLSAIGKYSYVSCSHELVDFNELLVGRLGTKEVVLRNSSPIPAKFKIATDGASAYSVQPTEGDIPAKSSFELKVSYLPSVYDMVNLTRFQINCEGGNELKLDCRGRAERFDVRFSTRSINFGEVKLEASSSRALTLTNNSQLQTTYQFFVDDGNIFSISEPKGVLPRNSYRKLIVEFHPRNTIAYYQRVYCIVRNHHLLHVDIIGTCYDLLIRPVPLLQVHVDLFRKRVIEGRLSEIDLKYLENNLMLKIQKKLEMLRDEKSLTTDQFEVPQAVFKQNELALHKQLFLEPSKHGLVQLSEDFLDFGYCENMTVSGQKEIELTNRMNCKLNISWILQKRQNYNGQYMTVFQVYPESQTIKAGASARFYVSFRPLKSNYYFFQDLQFFAVRDSGKMNKKTLEEYERKELRTLKPEVTLLKTLKVTQTIQSKVKDELEHGEILPPLSGVVKCVGHSFAPQSMSFIPIMEFRPSRTVVFAPCRPDESSYQTVELVNLSDTPTYYNITGDVQRAFRVYPKAGLIDGKSFNILTLEFAPTHYKQYNSTLVVHLNNSSGSPLNLQLTGICSEPKLRLHNDGRVYFPPTFTGVFTRQDLEIENLSKLPVQFHVEVPEKFSDEVFFEPSDGVLQAGENLKLGVCFIPQSKKQYKVKIPLKVTEVSSMVNAAIGYYNPGSGSENFVHEARAAKQVEYLVELFGQGSDGSLKLEKEQLDFQVVKVSEQKKLKVKLQNISGCTFYTELSLKPTDADSTLTKQSINSSFHLDFTEGIVAANSEILLGITFTPVEVRQFDLQLIVTAKDKLPKASKSLATRNAIKCQLRIRSHGSFPLLKIVDVRNDSISVAALWQNFQISRINQQLAQNLTTDEKKFLNIENLPYTEAQLLQNKLKAFEWNFGYVSSKSNFKPRKIIITVRNFGGTNLDYNFKFPSDNSIDEEIWADPGEPSKEEAYQKAILSKNIFQIKPRSDSLKPNDVRDIELIYTPANIQSGKDSSSNEKHTLTVVLQIKNGKPLVLNLKGMTLGPYEGLLAVKKTHYRLPNTPIGLLVPLKFPIEIQNVGSSKVNYKAIIQYPDNEFTEVFTISNPNNSLLPSEKHYLYCLFKPLEKKLYSFKLSIQVYDFVKLTQTVQVTLEGDGYEKERINHKTSAHQRPLKSIEDIPGQRSLVSQIGSKVFFSIEEIDFGVLRPNQTNHRMIILYNLSKNTSLNFQFPTQVAGQLGRPGLTCGDEFLIEPSAGEIAAGNFVELKITLTSARTPSVYEGEIECNIIWGFKFDDKDRMVHTEMSQKSAELNFEKETLFLRIKKSSSFEIAEINKANEKELKLGVGSEKRSLLDSLFESVISNSLNDPSLLDDIDKLYELPAGVADLLPADPSVSITKVDGNSDNLILPQSGHNNSNYKYLFLNDEFLDMADLIMENTFFNIMQETTHKENDLLRIPKKFVSAKGND